MASWIKLTDPMGHPVWLCADQMTRVRPYLAGIDSLAATADASTVHDHKSSAASLAKSVVDLVTGQQAVLETQDEVMERIGNAGKDDAKDKAAGV